MTISGPLHGIRIIELDAIGPVPLCGMILSGLGADIVHVARPGGHAAFDDLGEGVVLRGRRTLELNLKDVADRETLLKLVGPADALIEGMRPGVAWLAIDVHPRRRAGAACPGPPANAA